MVVYGGLRPYLGVYESLRAYITARGIDCVVSGEIAVPGAASGWLLGGTAMW